MAVGLTRFLWLCIGTIFFVVPFLPLTLRSTLDAGPVWWPHAQAWTIGSLSILVIGGVAGRITAAGKQYRWPHIVPPPRLAIPAFSLFLLAAASYAMIVVFASNPHLVDEVAQLFQGKVFAAQRLAAPTPEFAEFFLILNTFVTPAGWLSQYPPGQPALLGLGWLLGLEFLVNPLLAAASVYLVFQLAQQLFGPKTALVATFLWVTSGWVIFMSGTYQSHVGAVAFALCAWVTVLGATRITVTRGVVCGLALGMLGATRPLDAVAASIPIGLWLIHRRQWRACPWIALGALPCAVAVGFVNWKSFGHPLTFGYTALFGAAHGIGFHTDPYGWSFTPTDSLRNVFHALRRVNIYLFEWPIPAALPIALWALLASQRRVTELVVAVGILSLPFCYFFYWHSGYYIGPRFWYGMTPFLAIGTARAWRWMLHTARTKNTVWFRADMALRWGAIAILMWSFLSLLPARAHSYSQQLQTAKLHPERQLKRQGIERAVVLVPESWVSRTVAGMWSAGAPAGLVERAIGNLDTCDLDGLMRSVRRQAITRSALVDSLETMLARNRDPVPRLRDAPDPSTRLRDVTALPDRCVVELARDFDGFTLYGQFAWLNSVGLDQGIVFARDLFEENERLLVNYEGWDIWRFAPVPGDPTGVPILTRIRAGATRGLAEE